MHKPLPFFTVVCAAGMALALAATAVIAQTDKPAPPPAASDGPPSDPADVFKPKTYKETPDEVTQCEKTWDPQTGMSKQEYEAACKRTLKYFPEKDN